MKTGFYEELSFYYKRQGNVVLFSNGLTLNQFALEMWEKLGYTSVDPSVLSRILSGERKFTLTQLKAFAKVLNLSPLDFSNLQIKYCADLLSRVGITENILLNPNNTVSDFEEDFKKIECARSYEALDLACLWITSTEKNLRGQLRSSPKSIRDQLYFSWSELLVENGWTTVEHLDFKEACSELFRIIGVFEKLHFLTNNSQFLGLANAFRSRILFQQKRYQESLECDQRALKNLKDPGLIFWILNRIIITESILGHPEKIAFLNDQIEIYGNKLKNSRKILSPFFMDCLLRHHRTVANAYLISHNFKSARKHLDLAWDVYNKKIINENGNFKHRSKIILSQSEQHFHRLFGGDDTKLARLKQETDSLSSILGYKQYTNSLNETNYEVLL